MNGSAEKSEIPTLNSSLLDRVQDMEPDAWARLVNVFSPIVYRWARQAGLSGDDSADVVQDVFIAVARNIARFTREKEKASFRSWLATITRNRVRDAFRKRSRQTFGEGGTAALQRIQKIPGGVEDKPSANPGCLSEVELENTISLASLGSRLPRRLLEIVKDDCDPKTWEAFWLTTAKGDSAADVANRLGMNVASVYQAKSRILRRLRKLMGEIPE